MGAATGVAASESLDSGLGPNSWTDTSAHSFDGFFLLPNRESRMDIRGSVFRLRVCLCVSVEPDVPGRSRSSTFLPRPKLGLDVCEVAGARRILPASEFERLNSDVLLRVLWELAVSEESRELHDSSASRAACSFAMRSWCPLVKYAMAVRLCPTSSVHSVSPRALHAAASAKVRRPES